LARLDPNADEKTERDLDWNKVFFLALHRGALALYARHDK